jgi:hypothetical protein
MNPEGTLSKRHFNNPDDCTRNLGHVCVRRLCTGETLHDFFAQRRRGAECILVKTPPSEGLPALEK